MNNNIISVEYIRKRILSIRNKKVIIDRDLAELYGVDTKVLNQTVKRNLKRFPQDFMFQLSKKEKEEVVTNCDHLGNLKYSPQLPYVFTEQGVAMLSSVLNNDKAIMVNIQIMRTFIKIKEMILTYKDLKYFIEKIERRMDKYGGQITENKKNIQIIVDLIHQLMEPPKNPKKKIGFL